MSAQFEQEGVHGDTVQKLREAGAELDGAAMKWARRGVMGAGWVRLLEQMGVDAGNAQHAVSQLGKATL